MSDLPFVGGLKFPAQGLHGGYKMDQPETSASSDEYYSMFPIENEALLYTRWEDKVILDATVSSLVVCS